MPVLTWDKVGKRTYETGLDRGVLYLPDGSAVPWNGLTEVIEKFDKEVNPVYFDGMKVSNLVTLGDFAASMKAITYPDEFVEIEGVESSRTGIFLADQPPQTFGLCYRTQVGNDFAGEAVGYKIHVIYNLIAIPSDTTYATAGSDPSLVEFQWDISAIPEEIPGYRPTAHIIINTVDLDPWLLEDIEEILYGSTNAVAALIPMPDLVAFMNDWYRVKIVDNGDGTWTATSMRDGFISMLTPDEFQITDVNAIYTDDETFVISDTTDISDLPFIKIEDNGDGTWTAFTDHDGLISMLDADTFEIKDANVTFVGTNSYQISDTTE